MNIIYLQCNMQLNRNLLHPFADTTVIGAVVKKFARETEMLPVADVYDCAENVELISHLRSLGVQVRVSPISDITHRLLDFCETLEGDLYLLRVSGAQVLLNMDYVHTILEEMTAQDCDYFYAENNDGQVPEVVKASVILQNRDIIRECARYYQAFERIPDLKALAFSYPAMPIRVQATDRAMISILERYASNQELLRKRIRDVIYKAGSGSYLTSSGYLQSLIENELYDSEMEPVPWYTYSMIALLKERLRKDMKVFEFGSGYSTLFYVKRVRSVISVEHDYDWYHKIAAEKPANADIQYVELEYGGAYSKTIQHYHEEFDVICIDGRDRCNCARNCVPALKQDGVIIFDDTDREQYKEAYQYLKESGFKRLDFKGLIPALIYPAEGSTSIFYREDNCFGL